MLQEKTGLGKISQRGFYHDRQLVSLFTDTGNSHDGLTRGTTHFETCRKGDLECKPKPPQLIRYDGYKHLQEPASEIVPCIGPRGILINESDEDAIWAYPYKATGE